MPLNLILPSPANILGFLAIICYVLTLLPGIVRTLKPLLLKNKLLQNILKYRRQFGISAFSLGLLHGVAMIISRNISLTDPNTYIKYWPGFSLMLIFTILATTSNEWSINNMKKNWKKLHQMTFVIMFIAFYHVIDKVKSWTYLTPVVLTLLSVVMVLFGLRKYREFQKNKKISATTSVETIKTEAA